MSTRSLTCYGQEVDLDPIPVGSSISWAFTCEDPDARTVLDVTDWTFAFSLSALDLFGDPQAPSIAKVPTIVSALAGTLSSSWAPADTKSLAAGRYAYDLWGTDASGARLRLLSGYVELLATPMPAP